jgi:excinuclease ABC subunit A
MNTPVNPSTHIMVRGAKQHNLKSVDVDLPKNKLIVFTGLSGSGKSSLAFDTIYAEGQRKYVESLSSYARQFLGIMQKPVVDSIEGLSPAISIDQKTTSHNPRSTVGTITEIYDYLRLLYARIGHPACPRCGSQITPQSLDQIAHTSFKHIEAATVIGQPTRWLIVAPLVKDKKGEFSGLFDNLTKKGFSWVRVDGRIFSLAQDIILIKTNRHHIDAVIDRLTIHPKQLLADSKNMMSRLRQSFQQALSMADGQAILVEVLDASLDFPENPQNTIDHLFSEKLACPQCHYNYPELEPRLFSFNTPHGACPQCTGLGTLLKVDPDKLIAPELTISEGAIIPLAQAMGKDTWYSRKINAIFEAENIDPSSHWQELPQKIKNIILYGSKATYKVSGTNRQGKEVQFSFSPEGVVNEIERRYEETQSDFIRAEFERFMRKEVCPSCQGDRLKKASLSVTILDKNIAHVTHDSISRCLEWFNNLRSIITSSSDNTLSDSEKQIARSIVKEIIVRLEFLEAVGLTYLSLDREASTLAGGEAQRIRLASQIGTGLTGVLYVLDEPTIGLHPRDNDRLVSTLIKLKELGNTVLVVEHDQTIISTADFVVDFGPKAGEEGGEIVAKGDIKTIKASNTSLTGKYLTGVKKVDTKALLGASKKLHVSLKQANLLSVKDTIVLEGAGRHNLKKITANFPLGKLTVITGVSGSGKSTLMHETLYPALRSQLGLSIDQMPEITRISGIADISKVLLIDQSPIGRTPRSNPATYTKVFDVIRSIFASTKEARIKGYSPGRFSFNVKGGRCESCQGGGQVKISMQFLSDIYVTCEVCSGKRYNAETLEVTYKGLNISEVLNLTIGQAFTLFDAHSNVTKKLATLKAVGLGYIKLGQSATTLSGGEAQRVKLAKELSVSSFGHTVYLLDEPTTGLHFEDVKNLLVVLKQLVLNNNTVIVIEHNIDVIKNADWIIDLGPEGGDAGGAIVATGTVADIIGAKSGFTYKYLK